mgnify:CR=1 FL=1
MYDNLKDWFEDQKESIKDEYGYEHDHFVPMVINISNKSVEMQFNGFSLGLYPDGTYLIIDTTGG